MNCVSHSTLQFRFEIIFAPINICRFSFEYLLKFSTPCWNLNKYKLVILPPRIKFNDRALNGLRVYFMSRDGWVCLG